MNQRPVLTVLFGIIDNDEILLLKRKKQPYAGLWGMLAGKIEFGESPEQAVIREAKEESGLDIKGVVVKGIISEVIDDENKNHFYQLVCKAVPESKDFTDSNEGELKWLKISELEKDKLIPSEWHIINEILLKDKSIEIHNIKVKKQGEIYKLESLGVEK